MRKRLTILTALALVLSLAGAPHAQTTLNTTTLSAALDNSETRFNVASGTNITAGDVIVVDREAMDVLTKSTNTISVRRGARGTRAAAHANAATVVISDDGGTGFYGTEVSGSCTATSELFTPRIVLPSGNRYECLSSVWTRILTEPDRSLNPTSGIGYATGAGGAVTQITSASTGVTLNKVSGQVTTVALTTAAAAEEVFTVTNSTVAVTDTVVVSTTYAGAGTPSVSVKGMAAGSFVIVITNLHATAALDAVLVINFTVIKAVAA